MYFDNDKVEQLLLKYHERGCTSVALRDEIMSHANELIKKVILSLNLHHHNQDVFDELFQVSWCSIERSLYKFEYGKSKVFSLWSHITKFTSLAQNKKDSNDRTYANDYNRHGYMLAERTCVDFERFLLEAREVCKFIPKYLDIIDKIEKIWREDDNAHDGFVNKLMKETGLSHYYLDQFFLFFRTMSSEFTDSAIGKRFNEKFHGQIYERKLPEK